MDSIPILVLRQRNPWATSSFSIPWWDSETFLSDAKVSSSAQNEEQYPSHRTSANATLCMNHWRDQRSRVKAQPRAFATAFYDCSPPPVCNPWPLEHVPVGWSTTAVTLTSLKYLLASNTARYNLHIAQCCDVQTPERSYWCKNKPSITCITNPFM